MPIFHSYGEKRVKAWAILSLWKEDKVKLMRMGGNSVAGGGGQCRSISHALRIGQETVSDNIRIPSVPFLIPPFYSEQLFTSFQAAFSISSKNRCPEDLSFWEDGVGSQFGRDPESNQEHA